MEIKDIEKAKQIILNSPFMLYVSKEKIDSAFENIYVFSDEETFMQEYGYDDYKGEILEGFNRNNKSYIGPNGTIHTIIHEVLHGISSEFDKEGHRIKNGISGENYNFGNQVNEGLTDYLSAKLSGEKPRHYIQGHQLFQQLEPLFQKYTQDSSILFRIYANNDVEFIKEFFAKYGNKDTFETIYNRFLFMRPDEIDELIGKLSKKLDKDINRKRRIKKIKNFVRKIKGIFYKPKMKMLGEPQIAPKRNSHSEFIQQYRKENFESQQNYNTEQEQNRKTNEVSYDYNERDESI